ncbi:MAG: ABC transporter substrate-binding protein [Rhodoferax sp.]|jgi:putative ABC transport system substrate-binding protein|nr:ABC transporter substrate-binding protein [Rhodoferax sp.]
MHRRHLILAATSALAAPGLAVAQARPKPFRIGLLVGDLIAPHEDEALVAGLRQAGLVEGRNLVIERRVAGSRLTLVPGMARELAELKLDAVVATCSATTMLARQALGSTPDSTPIIMTHVADPVAQQFITSLARPGANVTGQASQAEEILPKMMGLFASVLPAKAKVAVLVDASSNVHPGLWKALAPIGESLSLRLVQVQAGRRPGQPALSAAFEEAKRQQVDGIFVLPDEPFFFTARAEIVALAERHRLPAFYGVREFVEAGGLMSYGESLVASFRGVGSYAAKLAAGAKPADLPVSRPTVFELVVNQKTATALGITVPRDVLLSAETVIQ